MRLLLLALCACVHVIGWGQINSYHAVKSKGSDNASFVVDNVIGLSEGDKVMIIQMKGGVTMNTTDGSSFGQVSPLSNYGNVGNYEIATVCKVEPDPINKVYFINKIVNDYDYTTGGKIQVVRIPVYESFNVTSLLEPSEWDSATGKGGVLAIIVEDDLTLGANISADGKGFKGGKFEVSSASCAPFSGQESYYYNPTNFNPQNGAYKGESIFRINMTSGGGKGANANGGGGGNNHNNGGGGGANLSSGGNGGGNSSEGFLTCRNFDPGIGGIGISVGSKDRIFLGGGGGAGHVNNVRPDFQPIEEFTGGGNGGGMIFIQASNLISNGFRISANGMRGANQQGDGASGGGAGGTIILNVTSYTGSVNIQANGGKGGDFDNEGYTDRCYGEGGGGSGGVVYFKGTKLATGVSVAGGVKGSRNYLNGCGALAFGANGNPGNTFGGYSYSLTSPTSPSCPESSSLPVQLTYFKVTNKGPHATAEWKVGNPEDGLQYILQRRGSNDSWKSIYTIAAGATTTYQQTDGPLATGIYLYRLKIVEKDHSVHYSPIQQITIKAEDINRLLIHPNPATNEITIVSPIQKDEWMNIYDMNSKLVYRKKITSTDALIKQDISFLAEGVYMVQVGKFTARFVVFK